MIRFVPPQVLHVAAQVARAFTIDSISLESFSASRRRLEDVHAAGQLDTNIKEDAEGALEDGGAALRAHVTFTFVAAPRAPRAKADQQPPIQLSLKFEILYRREFDVPLQPEHVQQFVEVNAIYNAWPYLREALSSFTQRLGLPPFTLDSLVIVPEPAKAIEQPVAPAKPTKRARGSTSK